MLKAVGGLIGGLGLAWLIHFGTPAAFASVTGDYTPAGMFDWNDLEVGDMLETGLTSGGKCSTALGLAIHFTPEEVRELDEYPHGSRMRKSVDVSAPVPVGGSCAVAVIAVEKSVNVPGPGPVVLPASHGSDCGRLEGHQETHTSFGGDWDWLTKKYGNLYWCEDIVGWSIELTDYTTNCQANSNHNFEVDACTVIHTDRSSDAVWGRSQGDYSWDWPNWYAHWFRDEEVARLDPAAPISCYFWKSDDVPGTYQGTTCDFWHL